MLGKFVKIQAIYPVYFRKARNKSLSAGLTYEKTQFIEGLRYKKSGKTKEKWQVPIVYIDQIVQYNKHCIVHRYKIMYSTVSLYIVQNNKHCIVHKYMIV